METMFRSPWGPSRGGQMVEEGNLIVCDTASPAGKIKKYVRKSNFDPALGAVPKYPCKPNKGGPELRKS